MMEHAQIDENLDEVKGKIKETWSRLSEEDVALYDEKFDQFLDVLKEKYGLGKEEVEIKLKQIDWAAKHSGDRAA